MSTLRSDNSLFDGQPEETPLNIHILRNKLTHLSAALAHSQHLDPLDDQNVALLPTLRAIDDIPAQLDELERDPENLRWVRKLRMREICEDVRQGVEKLAVAQDVGLDDAQESYSTNESVHLQKTKPASQATLHPLPSTLDDSSARVLKAMLDNWVPSFTSVLGMLAVGTFVALLFIKPQRPR